MRVVAVGCEYSGVTTLLTALTRWGEPRGYGFHTDDHFALPGGGPGGGLDEAEQAEIANAAPGIKERFQRFQVVYHIRLLNKYEHILLGGFHIEEQVYGPRFYYPPERLNNPVRQYETGFPEDTILVHLHASPAVIRSRMEIAPHKHQVVPADRVEEVQEAFATEVAESWIKHKLSIDTSQLAPAELLPTFFEKAAIHFSTADALRLSMAAGSVIKATVSKL